MNEPPLGRALIGELVGTAILVLLGDGVVASVVLLEKQADWIVITTGWALAVAIAIYVSGRLGGGHLNPAVTLALAARGDFPRERVLPYWVAQVAGGFLGAVIMYGDYAEAFKEFEHRHEISYRGQMVDGKLTGPAAGGAGVFANYPAFDNLARNVFSEILGTAILLIGVRALTDRRNTAPSREITPVLMGMIVWSVGLSLGGLTGYAINPARDFGPRLASAVLGWGTSVFQSHGWYFWVPIVGPLLGGLCGAYFYDLVISHNLPPADEPGPPGREAP